MRLILVVCALCVVYGLRAQEKLTTIMLVRHAEKEVSADKDPELSSAGRQRASKLAEMLSKTHLDAIYSTHFKRTEQTVAPVAQQHQLSIINYQGKPEEVDSMLSKHRGQTLLICGHSNTIPSFVNRLVGKEEYKTFDDADYGNFIVVTLSDANSSKATWLRY
jgi:phosphohistidine phosphatase SixA